MSTQAPPRTVPRTEPIARVIEPRARDLGGLEVRRVLPAAECRMIGPFIFFDHMGPALFPAGQGMDVRPHPHVCLATVTYLFEGELMHRDSLGFVQAIQPGAVNLMSAGRGIVHSERSGADRGVESRLHGIQSWMALPAEHEEMDPSFLHYPAEQLPELDVDGATVRIIAGSAYGRSSPVRVYSELVYLDVRVPAGCEFALPDGYAERAIYLVDGEIEIARRRFSDSVMAVAASGAQVRMRACRDAHIMVVGGEPIGERHIWWNFVSSSAERIERAKDDWRNGRFDKVPGETEFIPLP